MRTAPGRSPQTDWTRHLLPEPSPWARASPLTAAGACRPRPRPNAARGVPLLTARRETLRTGMSREAASDTAPTSAPPFDERTRASQRGMASHETQRMKPSRLSVNEFERTVPTAALRRHCPLVLPSDGPDRRSVAAPTNGHAGAFTVPNVLPRDDVNAFARPVRREARACSSAS